MYFSLFSVQAAVASAFSSHAPSKHGLACLFLLNIYGLTDHLNRKDIQRRSYFYLLYLYQTTLVLCWWIVGLLCHWDGYENCGPLLAFNLALLSLSLSLILSKMDAHFTSPIGCNDCFAFCCPFSWSIGFSEDEEPSVNAKNYMLHVQVSSLWNMI